MLGVVPAHGEADETAVVARVERWLDLVGLEPSERLLVSPACGMAGTDATTARRALEIARATGRRLG